MKKLVHFLLFLCFLNETSIYSSPNINELSIYSSAIPHLHVSEEVFSDGAVFFSGNSNLEMAKEIANYLNAPLGDATVAKFNDGEIQISIKDSVRNKNVFILQSTCHTKDQSVNDTLMELFLLVRTMKRSSAASITAVVPYYGYARQDRKTSGRVPISAADVALMLEAAGVDRIVTIDLHCGQIQGFFHHAPVDNLFASYMFASHFATKDLKNLVVVSPDAGGVERAKKFIENLTKEGIASDMALISKQREKAGVVGSMTLIGDVRGSDTIIIDDLCDTGGTIIKAAELLKKEGANRVFVVITHPVFSGNALKNIGNSVIDEMVITNTVPLREEAPDNVHCISVSSLFGEAIRRIQLDESLSDLFQ